MKTFVGIFLVFLSVKAQAADLNAIFSPDSKASESSRTEITRWLQANCKDLNWALRVEEISAQYERCSPEVEKITLSIELSHLRSEFVFWVKEGAKSSGKVEWLFEEWPSWHICSYSQSLFREDRSCASQP